MEPTRKKHDGHSESDNSNDQSAHFLDHDSEREQELRNPVQEPEREASKPTLSPSFPKPVYVKKQDGTEELIYNSAMMELNKIYEVEWNGKPYGIRKVVSEVEILRFYPDETGAGK